MVFPKFPETTSEGAPEALHTLNFVLVLYFVNFFQDFIPCVRLVDINVCLKSLVGALFVFLNCCDEKTVLSIGFVVTWKSKVGSVSRGRTYSH